MMMIVKRIPFEDFANYCIETNHFHVKNKVITENVTQLGPYTSDFEFGKQPCQAYGLFNDDYMIGTTQIQEWDAKTVRCRVYNIRPQYRGNDLFHKLLTSVIVKDWLHKELAISWCRSSLATWLQKHNFRNFDDTSYNHDNDVYRLVCKSIEDFKHDYAMLGEHFEWA